MFGLHSLLKSSPWTSYEDMSMGTGTKQACTGIRRLVPVSLSSPPMRMRTSFQTSATVPGWRGHGWRGQDRLKGTRLKGTGNIGTVANPICGTL